MTLLELLEMLDGAGLIVVDWEDLDACIKDNLFDDGLNTEITEVIGDIE